jgi:hypothetical protein
MMIELEARRACPRENSLARIDRSLWLASDSALWLAGILLHILHVRGHKRDCILRLRLRLLLLRHARPRDPIPARIRLR